MTRWSGYSVDTRYKRTKVGNGTKRDNGYYGRDRTYRTDGRNWRSGRDGRDGSKCRSHIAGSNGGTINLADGADHSIATVTATVPASGKVLIHCIMPFQYLGTGAPGTTHTYTILASVSTAYQTSVTLVPQDESGLYYDYFVITVPAFGLTPGTQDLACHVRQRTVCLLRTKSSQVRQS